MSRNLVFFLAGIVIVGAGYTIWKGRQEAQPAAYSTQREQEIPAATSETLSAALEQARRDIAQVQPALDQAAQSVEQAASQAATEAQGAVEQVQPIAAQQAESVRAELEQLSTESPAQIAPQETASALETVPAPEAP